jgi:hypothetical protein
MHSRPTPCAPSASQLAPRALTSLSSLEHCPLVVGAAHPRGAAPMARNGCGSTQQSRPAGSNAHRLPPRDAVLQQPPPHGGAVGGGGAGARPYGAAACCISHRASTPPRTYIRAKPVQVSSPCTCDALYVTAHVPPLPPHAPPLPPHAPPLPPHAPPLPPHVPPLRRVAENCSGFHLIRSRCSDATSACSTSWQLSHTISSPAKAISSGRQRSQ